MTGRALSKRKPDVTTGDNPNRSHPMKVKQSKVKAGAAHLEEQKCK